MRTFVIVVLIGLAAFAADEEEFDVLLDFETGEPADGWVGGGLGLSEVRVEGDKTPSGGRALTLSGVDDGDGKWVGYVYRKIPESDWCGYDALTFYAKVKAKSTLHLRILAFSPGGTRAMLRRFTLDAGDWRKVKLPLRGWRENIFDFAGDFRKIIGFTFRWDKGSGEITLDDFRLVKGDRKEKSCYPTLEDRMSIAFPTGKGKAIESDHFVLMTNAVRLKGRDGKKLLARFEKAYDILSDRFLLPGKPPYKAPIAIFKKEQQYKDYFPRLGVFVGANISPPQSDGYSVLDVAASTYLSEYGWERRVYVHEAVHVAIRLRTGLRTNGNWIQEGLANAVQLAIYPETAKDVDWAAEFKAFKAGKGLFLPWPYLLAKKRPSLKNYAQLASMMDFLADRHSAKLVQFWLLLSKADKSVHEDGPRILEEATGKKIAELQAEWMEWGLKKYSSE